MEMEKVVRGDSEQTVVVRVGETCCRLLRLQQQRQSEHS
jgi:hypothetical protein